MESFCVEILISSQKKFNAYEAPDKYYVTMNELLNYPKRYENKVNLNGFMVIKNVISKENISVNYSVMNMNLKIILGIK